MDEALSGPAGSDTLHTLAHVLIYASGSTALTGSPLMHAEELLALSTEQKFPQCVGLGTGVPRTALTALGQAQEGLALLTQALAQLRAIGAVNGLPRLLAWLAEASRHAWAAC